MDERWRVLVVLTTARTAMGFQLQTVGSVAPALREALSIDDAAIGFLIGVFLLPGIALALPSGIIGNRFGDKRIVLFGLALMVIGSSGFAMAPSYHAAVVARAACGSGGVLLNVLLAKIVTELFSGREVVLAMAILLNAFPIGIGLGQFVFPRLSGAWGWPSAFWCSTAMAAASFLTILLWFQEPRRPRGPVEGLGLSALSRSELIPVCLVGIVWAIYNGAYVTFAGFAQSFLEERGFAPASAATWLGVNAAIIIASVQIGGWLGRHRVDAGPLALVGVVLYGAVLSVTAIPRWEIVGVIAAGLVGGLPAGALYSIPGRYLRPENRAVGMGIFLTWLYIGFAVLPMAAGWLAAVTGSTTITVLFSGVTVLASVPCLVALGRGASPPERVAD